MKLFELGLPLVPKANANFARAVYVGFLYGVFHVCSGMLSLRYFGGGVRTTLVSSSVIAMLAFAYLVYLILELEVRIQDDAKPIRNKTKP